ncbi:MAG: trypsin-like peptidase domain-containing protein [Pirellulaceae bacterium]
MRRTTLFARIALVCLSAALVEPTLARGQGNSNAIDFDREFAQLDREADLFETRARLVKSVVRLCQPSVVHLKAIKGDVDSGRRARTVEEAGAGVILSHRGVDYVITNRHVVKFATVDHIHVYTHDGIHVNPTAMWEDPDTDLAVLRLPNGPFVAARFDDSAVPDVGEFVVAIGSPFGLNHSVTCGIVSALGHAISSWARMAFATRISSKPTRRSTREIPAVR